MFMGAMLGIGVLSSFASLVYALGLKWLLMRDFKRDDVLNHVSQVPMEASNWPPPVQHQQQQQQQQNFQYPWSSPPPPYQHLQYPRDV